MRFFSISAVALYFSILSPLYAVEVTSDQRELMDAIMEGRADFFTSIVELERIPEPDLANFFNQLILQVAVPNQRVSIISAILGFRSTPRLHLDFEGALNLLRQNQTDPLSQSQIEMRSLLWLGQLQAMNAYPDFRRPLQIPGMGVPWGDPVTDRTFE